MGEFSCTYELWHQAVHVGSTGICMVVLVHCMLKFLSASFVDGEYRDLYGGFSALHVKVFVS